MKFGKTFDKSLGVCLRHIRYCCCCAWQLLGMSRCLNTQPIDASFSPFEVSPLRLTALQLELFAFSVSADSATETFFCLSFQMARFVWIQNAALFMRPGKSSQSQRWNMSWLDSFSMNVFCLPWLVRLLETFQSCITAQNEIWWTDKSTGKNYTKVN